MATTRKRTNFDAPATPGSYDWILRDIRDEVARATPPPPPTPPVDPPRPPRVRVEVEIVDKPAMARAQRRQGQWAMAVLLWTIVIGVVGMAWLTGAIR